MNFEELDLLGALKDVQTDCDICFKAISDSDIEESSLIYWKKRYNRMVSVANALRVLISHDDTRFSEPYSTRSFEIGSNVSNESNNKFGLSTELYHRFKILQDKHFNGWESENRKDQHSLDNIEKVEYLSTEDLFYVYYKKTKHFSKEWYHYDTNRGVWW